MFSGSPKDIVKVIDFDFVIASVSEAIQYFAGKNWIASLTLAMTS
jgi:hypothetical protein